MRPLTIDDMNKLAEKHGGICVSKVYTNMITKLIWQCKQQHLWMTTPMVIKKGSWCPTCARQRRNKASSLSLEDMHDLARKHGGKCLSTKYYNNKVKLLWECIKEHQFEKTPKAVKTGSWCPKCKKAKNWSLHKHTMREMQVLAETHQGKCLSKTYKGVKVKLLWECMKKHQWEAVPDSIIRGTWCPVCAHDSVISRQKLTLNDMQKMANKYGGRCLSMVYENFHSSLLWECRKEHKFEATPNAVKSGTWCLTCAYDNGTRSPKPTLQDMQDLAAKQGGICLSKEFKKITSKLSWQCEKDHIWDTTPRVILRGSWCPTCADKRRGEILRLPFNEIQEFAKLKGGKCISSKYFGFHFKLLWECSKAHIWEATPETIKYGSWCPKCTEHLKTKDFDKTLDYCKSLATRFGGKCLSSHFENEHTKLKWECNQRHSWISTLHSVQQSDWCPICAVNLKASKRFISLLEELNLFLLELKKEYLEEFKIQELIKSNFKQILDIRLQKIKEEKSHFNYDDLNDDEEFVNLYNQSNKKLIILSKLKQLASRHGYTEATTLNLFKICLDIKDFTFAKTSTEIAFDNEKSVGYILKLAHILFKEKSLYNCRFHNNEDLPQRCLEIAERFIIKAIDGHSYINLISPKFQNIKDEYLKDFSSLGNRSIFATNLLNSKFMTWLRNLPERPKLLQDRGIQNYNDLLLMASKINKNQEMLKFVIHSLLMRKLPYNNVSEITTKGRFYIRLVAGILNSYKSSTTKDYYLKIGSSDTISILSRNKLIAFTLGMIENLIKKYTEYYIIKDLFRLNLNDIKKNFVDHPETKYLLDEFSDINMLISAKKDILKNLDNLKTQLEKYDPKFITQIFLLILCVKDFLFGAPMLKISKDLHISSGVVSRDALFILGSKEIFEKRFYSSINRRKLFLSIAEQVITNKIAANSFSNLINPQLQDLMSEYRYLSNKTKRRGIFTRYKISVDFSTWIKSLNKNKYEKILENYKHTISRKHMLKICKTININFEIPKYIIYSIINSVDKSREIAEVCGINSGTILNTAKLLNTEVSPTTGKFFIQNYYKRFGRFF